MYIHVVCCQIAYIRLRFDKELATVTVLLRQCAP